MKCRECDGIGISAYDPSPFAKMDCICHECNGTGEIEEPDAMDEAKRWEER